MTVRPGCLVALCLLALPQTAVSQVRWSVDAKPTFDLGAESDDTLDTFALIRGVTRLATGEIVVADGRYFTLRYFGANGVFRRSVGRRGDGPGEFQSITRMLRCGDSLFIFRSNDPLVQVFHVNGTFKRNMQLATPQPQWSTPHTTSCNDQGHFLSYGWENSKDRKAGTFRSVIPFWFNTADGKLTKVIAELLGSERFGQTRQDGSLGGSGPLPLGKLSVIAIGHDRAYVGTADSFAIHVFDLNGKPLAMIRKPRMDLKTTPADIARYIRLDTTGRSPTTIRSRLAQSKQVKWPATLPAYSAFVVDSDDNLWVQSFPRASEATSRWTVFSPRGLEVARIELPLDLAVKEIGRDYVLGVALEPPDDVQHVKVYRLRRG